MNPRFMPPLALAVLLQGCSGGGSVDAPAIEQGRFARATGALQCDPPRVGVADRQRAQAALEAAGIGVQALACGHDGLMRVTVCGAESGELMVVDASAPAGAGSLDARMAALGYRPWSAWPQGQIQTCPPG